MNLIGSLNESKVVIIYYIYFLFMYIFGRLLKLYLLMLLVGKGGLLVRGKFFLSFG